MARAAVLQPDKKVKVQDVKVPKPTGKQILVKVIAGGLNPTDWKNADLFQKTGTISGCDAAGVVVELGPEVDTKEVQIGQRRGFFIKGGSSEHNGAFSEYALTPYNLSFVVPSNLSFAQAASIPIPFFTAVQALYFRLGLPEPPSGSVKTPEPILIWSGASAVGQYAIQLAKLTGLEVVTTAGEASRDLVKGLGATEVFDYKDPDVSKKIKDATGGKLRYALDCFSEGDSTAKIQLAMSDNGGEVVTILFPKDEDLPRKDIKTTRTLLYTVLGEPHSFGPGNDFETSLEQVEHHSKWQKIATQLFESGKVKPLKVRDGGRLEDVQQGFDLMKGGGIRAEKLVFHVQDE